MGTPPTGSSVLGVSSEWGRSRVAQPAARMTAFTPPAYAKVVLVSLQVLKTPICSTFNRSSTGAQRTAQILSPLRHPADSERSRTHGGAPRSRVHSSRCPVPVGRRRVDTRETVRLQRERVRPVPDRPRHGGGRAGGSGRAAALVRDRARVLLPRPRAVPVPGSRRRTIATVRRSVLPDAADVRECAVARLRTGCLDHGQQRRARGRVHRPPAT